MNPFLLSSYRGARMLCMVMFCWLLVLTPATYLWGNHPNVLFIAVDDLRCDLGCYGQKTVRSPHIDQLAARSTLFSNAYCAQAVCNPSRASLLTGLRPDKLRVWDLPTHFRETTPDAITLPQWFKQNGYHTECIGKIFHNWRQDSFRGDAQSWSVPEVMHYNSHGNDTPEVAGQLPPNLSKTPRTEMRDVPDEAYFDGRIARLGQQALHRLRTNQQPFFLAIGFWKPHAPFNAPKKYWDMIDHDLVSLPDNPNPPADVPELALHDGREILRGFNLKSGQRLDTESVRQLRHGYYAGISYLDAQIGKVLDELERLDLDQNTIIVFWSDHGFHLGEHNLWAKTSNFELDARVPMMISLPNQPAKQVSSIVELLDLFPTLIALCNLPQLEHLQGTSLAELCRGQNSAGGKGYALTQHTRPAYPSEKDPLAAMGYSLRTAEFRYTQWRAAENQDVIAEELYDHQLDTAETKNLAHYPAYRDVQKALAQQLNALAP